MRVVIAHNAVAESAGPDERDVLVQVEAVRQALQVLGHSSCVVPVDLNLAAGLTAIRGAGPDVVFNLVESLGGSDQLAPLAAAAFETLGVPLTGSPSHALWLTNHKILAKQRLQQASLPTPVWFELSPEQGRLGCGGSSLRIEPGARFILKPVTEHASWGMDEAAVIRPRDTTELRELVQVHRRKIGRACFAEQFLAGREFNVSLLAEAGTCRVLPLAEIDFSAFPPGKPQIVDFKAKWDESSFEYRNTPRRFIDSAAEPDLYQLIGELAGCCWSLFQLAGYARVDMRCDDRGQPLILEINTNPCLSPDAGFSAALTAAGLSFTAAVERILQAAVQRQPPGGAVAGLVPEQGKSTRESRAAGDLTWRYEVTDRDPAIIRDLVDRTGFFYPDEVDIAEELVRERVERGMASGYYFVLAELEGRTAGYACYGPIACTRDSYDLYWIAVHPDFQNRGLGRLILTEAERCIRTAGGRRVYIETSNRELYESTRGFYLRCGYLREAVLAEFYGPGDDKVVYVKALVSG